MAKQVKLLDRYNDMLDEVAKERLNNGNLVNTKQSIVAELIEKAYKKEVKE